jgi:tripartite-type tricarboxylate transporter receptor subunit TctC
MLGLDITHVPYQGGLAAINSTVAGHTQVLAITLPLIAPLVKDRKLRLLGVADKARSTDFPNVQTLQEAGITGREVGFWNGILLPKGTARNVMEQLHRQVMQVMSLSEVKERLAALGYATSTGSPEAFAAHLKAELSNWSAIAREENIKIE